MEAEELTRALGGRWYGDHGRARCPAHDDRNPSLSISIGKDVPIVLHCHGGCSNSDVIDALVERNLWTPKPNGNSGVHRSIVAEYDYVDELGVVLFQVVRMEPKAFRQRRPLPGGGWEWRGPKRFVPYRLPDILRRQSEPIWIVEGEKDADNLHRYGILATTNAGGAGKWREELNDHFRGRTVFVVPDGDTPGQEHARSVARHLRAVAASVRILELPEGFKDISELIDAGRHPTELLAFRHPVIGGRALMAAEYPPLIPLVDQLIVPGLTLLTAKPKVGKSWMALAMGLAVASGGQLFGDLECAHAGVLMLMLEDSPRRLQARCKQLLGMQRMPEQIAFCTSWSKGEETVADVEEYLDQHPDVKLVVVDVLQKIKGEESGKSAYADDYASLERLQGMAQRRDVAVVVLHHLRKAEGTDAVDLVSGTLGIAGAADHIIVITGNADDGYQLEMKGRELRDVAWSMALEDGRWSITGEAVRKSKGRPKTTPDIRDAVVACREAGMTTRKISEELGVSKGTVSNILTASHAQDA